MGSLSLLSTKELSSGRRFSVVHTPKSLRVAKELDANGVSWTRPSYFLWEDDNSVKHRYYPDFYLPEYGVYLDPKNDYLINNKTARFGITDTEKIQRVKEQNGIQILILDKDHLTWKSIRENLTRGE